MINIVHIFWSFTFGGAETMAVDIMNQQVKTNKVSLIVINRNYDPNILKSLDSDVNVFLLDRSISSRNPLPFIQLNLLLFKESYDAIHCHNYNLEKIIGGIFLKKTILTVHGFHRPINSLNKYSKVVAISNVIAEDLKQKGLKNLVTVFNGVDTKNILSKKEFNDKLILGCIGRLNHDVKGQDIVLEAFALMKKEKINAKLVFIGDGPSKPFLLSLLKELNLNSKVQFRDVMQREDLYRELKNFDLLIQPSRHEGFGLTAIEAMAAKVPLIVSDASGLIEVTAGGKYAEVFSPKTPEKLVEKIIKVIEEMRGDSLQKRLIEAAEYVDERFSIESTCDHYFHIYTKCIQENYKINKWLFNLK